MTKDETLRLLRGGEKGVRELNRRIGEHHVLPSLRGADLHDCDLSGVNLGGADLMGANLGSVDLSGAMLVNANLIEANVSNTMLSSALFYHSHLSNADFSDALWGWTILADVDLREVHGLGSAEFNGPCSVSLETLIRSKGRVPEIFLQSCGLQRWQVIQTKTYDPDLTRDQFTDLLYQMDIARNQGPLFIGGVFISYSHDDTGFVDKIRSRLYEEGAPVWLDRHDMVAGDMQKQVSRAIRLNDVVLLVLSESSVKSDWVEHELEMARKKEKDEGRDVLCPVALDDSWKDKMNDVLWRQVKKTNVLDFSKWKTKAFDAAYHKLTAGLKVNYGPAAT